jgi:hypothetical protein
LVNKLWTSHRRPKGQGKLKPIKSSRSRAKNKKCVPGLYNYIFLLYYY